MEAVVLHQSDQFCMEPLNSYVDIFDLYIGNTSIWTETMSNLWYSGVNKVYLLVESYKVNKYNHLSTESKAGGKEPKIKVEVVGLNVKMEVGTALREFFRLHGPMEPFILLYSNTLLTVPLTEAVEFHTELAKANSSYCMTVLYVEDEKKRFSGFKNNKVILYDEKNELLYSSDENVMELESEFLKSLKSEQIKIRYDLYQPGVYLCTNLIIETFLELFDQSSMEQLIVEMLTQEIKTSEMYMYTVKNDLSFPEYPAALRVETPRDYYNAYTEYVKRFKSIGGTGTGAGDTTNTAGRGGLELNSNVSGSLVGSGVRIGQNTNITNSIVFNNVVIGSNCKVNNAIIMNNVTIEDSVTLEPGSLIGPCCRVDKDLMSKSGSTYGSCSGNSSGSGSRIASGSRSEASTSSEAGPVRCATMKTKFYDLTGEREEDEDGSGSSYVWEVEAFIANPLNKIGSQYYDHVTFTMPDSAESTSDYEDSEDDEEYDSEELAEMVHEALEDPKNLENKLLEIRSLRVAHNVTEHDTLDHIYKYGIEWLVEEQVQELIEIVESARMNKLLDAFASKLARETYYDNTLSMCSKHGKSQLFFCQMCEALYHTDVLEFEGFEKWLEEKNLKEDRLVSFAKWVES
ncbi:uncharacterized protein TOT_010000153 [Theileria orientalis strain Shintoku]|uniref:Translation initiation factor eIF2B subunit epsilon n=1 Tax=Theileria orientalis strain Shintoku TaxID=869250 RepID=J7MGR5_THEOR|nr:uncharacterized protein TOT_010000153 [Theileria orientalis strain Shintoku]BAM38686.1 uncharacterized protein TOT_010000153 [Theileria orientalis strain Shintoku]|eukprot:XP_009688987.1 uncharacterized protein TOT_010000153 [Theileria orientalis strain Shintoku]